ncbi:hypothetical protein P154DRAFT_596569 [Amniculicola lignicola CBS 123094]|uniref:RNase H type-1 domain-containing protein n=1 Tax=Amniculicola lignicola CBS 123094 TaxID=1392246 RepID=A0A6A5WUY0_9PLEO|nr:hypothetical protein P154DRAFT_596569 [Amniculicola lignicola CBS 123094]
MALQEIQIRRTESLYPFPDAIIIAEKRAAAAFAHSLYRQGATPRTLVLWVDGSADCPDRLTPCSSAIGYHDPLTLIWKEEVHICLSIPIESPSQEAELLAIREGFKKAMTLTEHFDKLILLSDSQSTLSGIGKMSCTALKNMLFLDDVLECANGMYDAGIEVELHWVPSEAKVTGHVRVDQHSREYRKRIRGGWPAEVALAPITVAVHETALEELPGLVKKRVLEAKESGVFLKIDRKVREQEEQWRLARTRVRDVLRRIKKRVKGVKKEGERLKAQDVQRKRERNTRKKLKQSMRKKVKTG